jgi:membrane-associated phospholipid phosphatase
MNWKEFLTDKKKQKELIITIPFLATILIIFPQFLQFVESRPGVALPDPIIALFNPIDLTWLTFGLIYLSIFIALFLLAKKPERLLFTFQCYGLMVLFRMIVMYLLPLEAPAKLLPLNDPFVQLLGTGEILTKDLFFSGHTATLFLLFLIMEKQIIKMIFLTTTILVGIAILLQHVHYVVDVAFAPFFAYTSYKIIDGLRNKLYSISI